MYRTVRYGTYLYLTVRWTTATSRKPGWTPRHAIRFDARARPDPRVGRCCAPTTLGELYGPHGPELLAAVAAAVGVDSLMPPFSEGPMTGGRQAQKPPVPDPQP